MNTMNTMNAICFFCSAVVRLTDDGRMAPHRITPHPLNALAGLTDGEMCPSSGEIPWRRRTPSVECVRAHLEWNPQVGEGAAFFDVQHMGAFHARVTACIEDDRVSWGVVLPICADGEMRSIVFDPPPADAPDYRAWLWRPVSMRTGCPRPWVDAPEAMATEVLS